MGTCLPRMNSLPLSDLGSGFCTANTTAAPPSAAVPPLLKGFMSVLQLPGHTAMAVMPLLLSLGSLARIVVACDRQGHDRTLLTWKCQTRRAHVQRGDVTCSSRTSEALIHRLPHIVIDLFQL